MQSKNQAFLREWNLTQRSTRKWNQKHASALLLDKKLFNNWELRLRSSSDIHPAWTGLSLKGNKNDCQLE